VVGAHAHVAACMHSRQVKTLDISTKPTSDRDIDASGHAVLYPGGVCHHENTRITATNNKTDAPIASRLKQLVGRVYVGMCSPWVVGILGAMWEDAMVKPPVK
jgi:hypothetical protein